MNSEPPIVSSPACGTIGLHRHREEVLFAALGQREILDAQRAGRATALHRDLREHRGR